MDWESFCIFSSIFFLFLHILSGYLFPSSNFSHLGQKKPDNIHIFEAEIKEYWLNFFSNKVMNQLSEQLYNNLDLDLDLI